MHSPRYDQPPAVAVSPSYKGLRRAKAAQDDRWKLEGGRRGLLGVWLNLTAPPPASALASVAERERLRKAELSAYVAFGILLLGLALIPNGLQQQQHSTLFGVILIALAGVGAAILNRANHTVAAAIILIAVLFISVGGAMAASKNLDLMWMPALDFFAVPVFLSGLLLSRRAPFFAAGAGIAAVVLLLELKPRDPWLTQMVAQLGIYHFMVRPVMLMLIVAIASWLGARSVEQAIRRADRAEEVAAMEHQMAEQKRQLDRGIQNLLETHVRVANGDFSARAATTQDNVLWQIAVSLNNLLSRLGKYATVEQHLARTEREIDRVAIAADSARAGRSVIWPAASGTRVDRLLTVLTAGQRQHHGEHPPAPPADGFGAASPTRPQAHRQPARPPTPGGTDSWNTTVIPTITGEWREVSARHASAQDAFEPIGGAGAGRPATPSAPGAAPRPGAGEPGSVRFRPTPDPRANGAFADPFAQPFPHATPPLPRQGPSDRHDAAAGATPRPAQRPPAPSASPASHWEMEPLPPLPSVPLSTPRPTSAPRPGGQRPEAAPPPDWWSAAQRELAQEHGASGSGWRVFSESFPGQLDHSPARQAQHAAHEGAASSPQRTDHDQSGRAGAESAGGVPAAEPQPEDWPDWPGFLKSLGDRPE
jgi:hypothetical protein